LRLRAGGECTCAQKKSQLVYAIGRLDFSFISETRRASIERDINRGLPKGEPRRHITNATLQELIRKEPYQAQSVVWTLSRSSVPMYAIVPAGAFAAATYEWLVKEWSDKDVEFVSLPGTSAGQVALYDGHVVDAIVPELRGMFSWDTDKYIGALKEALKKANPNVSDDLLNREMKRFFGKIQFSIRNRGLSAEERAINAAATNAFNVSDVIVEAGEEGLTLRDIAVERSPLSRPGGEYFDVLLTFFDPEKRAERAPLRARFTIDVSDTVPVPVSGPVTWHEY
jgi:PatG C-terminal/PatG Domain